jgi:hypothetical protein
MEQCGSVSFHVPIIKEHKTVVTFIFLAIRVRTLCNPVESRVLVDTKDYEEMILKMG